MTDAPPPTMPPDRATRAAAQWRDVGFLRHLWRNEALVAPGVWRSNHPGPRRLAEYAARGITTVLSLRGDPGGAAQRVEAAACARLGIDLHILGLNARRAPHTATLLSLFEFFDELPRPFLMHCKSGADRTGLAAALYLMDQEGAGLDAARTQLSARFLHFRRSETGILDAVLDRYAPHAAMPVRTWVRKEYDRDAVTESFARTRRKTPE